LAFLTNNSSFDGSSLLSGPDYDKTTTPSNATKIQLAEIEGSDFFGITVAIGAGKIYVGAIYDDDGASTNDGAVYILDYDGNKIDKIYGDTSSYYNIAFGKSLCFGSDRLIVGGLEEAKVFSVGGSLLFELDIFSATGTGGTIGDTFGASAAIGNGRIICGVQNDDDVLSNAGTCFLFDLNGNFIKKLLPSPIDDTSNTNASAYFGSSVAIGDGRIVVGAKGDDANGYNSGAAYIYDLDGNELAKIDPSGGAGGDNFGSSVAVGSGKIVVGAQTDNSNAGSAYIYDLDGGNEVQLSPSGGSGRFGQKVHISSNRIYVGAPSDSAGGTNAGAFYIFDMEGNQLAKFTGSSGQFLGCDIASADGKLVVGAYGDPVGSSINAGAIYIYDIPDQTDKLTRI